MRKITNYILELSSTSLHNWNDGMVEYWNNGMAPFGQINAYGEDGWDQGFSASFSLTTNACNAIIPLFHYPIIPVGNMQNGWLRIPYYQQFVEFSRHQILNQNLDNPKGGHGLHPGSFRLQTMTAFNKKFLQGGPGGAVFSKSAPPGRRRQIKIGGKTYGRRKNWYI